MKSVCEKYGALFILDEVGCLTFALFIPVLNIGLYKVMSGMGRK